MMVAPRRVSQRYTAEPEFAAVARARLVEYLRDLELTEERQFAILYATGEALANAIEHGTTSPGECFNFRIERRGGHLRVQIESTGCWQAFEPSEERGRGIPIMEALADQVDITTHTGGTIVHLSFRL